MPIEVFWSDKSQPGRYLGHACRVIELGFKVEKSFCYLFGLFFFEVSQSLTVLPEARFLCPFAWVDQRSEPMLLAINPPPLKHHSIPPKIRPKSMPLALLKLTLIPALIPRNKNAIAVHLVLAPLAEVFLAVGPLVRAKAGDLVVEPLARVSRVICVG